MNNAISQEISEYYVVFIDETSLWWLRFLKKGFRHCYLLFQIDEGMTWVEANPMSNRFFFCTYSFCEKVDYIAELKKQMNCEIILQKVENVGLKIAPLSFFSCVEFVKRSLGIHSFWTITPYQLYKKLKIVGKKS
ncbi:MAG: hypothetical protein PHE89_05560 [Alphaproteobacteria bacterium]|nr:hypothetical protein [Alphaproteobacteria bacterium]